MAYGCMKRCSTTLTRETQVRTPRGVASHLLGWLLQKNTLKHQHCRGCGEEGSPVSGDVRWCSHCGKE